VDTRTKSLSFEYKTCFNPSIGTIRSVTAVYDWFAVGYSSGAVSLLDLRMGPILRMWQAHENDITCCQALSDTHFITSSLQTMSLWDVSSGTALVTYKSLHDPLKSLHRYKDQVISASTANRIMIHSLPSDIAETGGFTSRPDDIDNPKLSVKLRSDVLKGSLSAMSILRMKRQIIVGTDNGSLKLFS